MVSLIVWTYGTQIVGAVLHGVRKCMYKDPALQPPKWVRIYPQRVRVALRIKLQESRLQGFWSSGSAFQVSRKSIQLKVLCILIPVMPLHVNSFPSNKIDLQLVPYDAVNRNKVSIRQLPLYFPSHCMFRPLRAIFRWDTQLDILRTIFDTTDPLHVHTLT
jgi:hypothetical protein